MKSTDQGNFIIIVIQYPGSPPGNHTLVTRLIACNSQFLDRDEDLIQAVKIMYVDVTVKHYCSLPWDQF